ncbi:hypothetical protein E2P84_31255 [Burkholderia cepacia]|uniref:Uncharacterized protein n=1 Tax=Burkholderia cepacia TaxID=292 RepID=A0AAX2REX6_BURCE|nr:hypothetical protein [Burkholderia cepacia]MDN7902154.1 hypothetical protein [Burkholderia cepacia]TES70167.1 hypothetical protein E2P84_31255 [Burkholderia cepacia]TES97468.1 hypothetical protein E3D36_32475 [Burkholderia cepacia]TEU35297.1 hypothetical protein E3D37_37815 [Burkholderia cepacia]TEU40425.1 hypothetical protein E3D38_34670 [Burkholderia cepacia]
MCFHCGFDSVAALFAPVYADSFDMLIAEFKDHRVKIDELAGLVFGSGYSRVYDSEFETARVSIVLMRARRPGNAVCSSTSKATMQAVA